MRTCVYACVFVYVYVCYVFEYLYRLVYIQSTVISNNARNLDVLGTFTLSKHFEGDGRK